MACSGRITCETKSNSADAREQIGNANLARDKGPPFPGRNKLASATVEAVSPVEQEQPRGPTCVLERLPETVARLVSGGAVSRQQRAGEDPLPSNQQGDRQPHQIPQGGRGDRR